jgi:fucose 4-O-acetylase-like acetyltransferase
VGAGRKTGVRQYMAWVDCAKGIGICLVVLGHIAQGGVRDFIYVFHMPLFFFLSGFLHRVDSQFVSYAKKKALHLLVPYVWFVILTTLMKAPHFIERGMTPARLKHGLFVLMWGGEAMKGAYGVLWFLTCLFLTQQVGNWLLVRFRTTTAGLAAAISMLLSYVIAWAAPRFSLPLDANVVLASLPFFLAGYFSQRFEFTSRWMLAIAAPGVVVAITLLACGASLPYDMRGGVYGLPFITPLLALACIFGCVYLSQHAARHAASNYILARLGAVSLPIMFLHKELPGVPGYRLVERVGVGFDFFVTLLISYALADLCSRSEVTRAFLLGSSKDLERLSARWKPRIRSFRPPPDVLAES